jgi:transposase
MAATPRMLPDLSGLDADALRALILAQQEELASCDTEIENLKLLILKLKRLQFGRKSEKLDKQIEQLELRLEDLEANQTARPPSASTTAQPVSKPVRRPLPEHYRARWKPMLPSSSTVRIAAGQCGC